MWTRWNGRATRLASVVLSVGLLAILTTFSAPPAQAQADAPTVSVGDYVVTELGQEFGVIITINSGAASVNDLYVDLDYDENIVQPVFDGDAVACQALVPGEFFCGSSGDWVRVQITAPDSDSWNGEVAVISVPFVGVDSGVTRLDLDDPFLTFVETGESSIVSGLDGKATVRAQPLCEGLKVTINMQAGDSGLGTSGPDVILGTANDDVIRGRGGDDVICAGDGNDTVYGGPGADQVQAGPGDDVVYGHAGDDFLRGGPGNDEIRGGIGNDLLRGDTGNDTLRGGEGDDGLRGGADDDELVGNRGFDNCRGNAGNDNLRSCES